METLATKKTLTVMAFGAHPDPFDMPYQAGGTLAEYARRGHRVVMVAAARAGGLGRGSDFGAL